MYNLKEIWESKWERPGLRSEDIEVKNDVETLGEGLDWKARAVGCATGSLFSDVP